MSGATTTAAATSASQPSTCCTSTARDWKLIFVGDAAMSPYELVQPGGSVEYANDEPGAAWLARLIAAYRHAIWLNPEPERTWQYTRSTQMVQELLGPRMFPLTLDGLQRGMAALRK